MKRLLAPPSSVATGLLATLRRLFLGSQPVAPEASQIEHNAARVLQRAYRRQRFYLYFGESMQDRWIHIVNDATRERRRERKEYVQRQKKVVTQLKRVRQGGALREDWAVLKQPPGGVIAANPHVPLKRVTVWTHHDVS